MEEIWKDIEGYEGLYQVSNLGRVKSLERKCKVLNGYRTVNERIRSLNKNRYGYITVSLNKNNKTKICTIHRLVAIAFIENPENKIQVNHIDGDKSNNTVDNLEWVSQEENMQHAVNTGLLKFTEERNYKISSALKYKNKTQSHRENISKSTKGKKHYYKNKHPKSKSVICITTGEIFKSMSEAAKKYNINTGSKICECCRGKRKSAGKHPITKEKLAWKYIE